jgi:hypothetical protein
MQKPVPSLLPVAVIIYFLDCGNGIQASCEIDSYSGRQCCGFGSGSDRIRNFKQDPDLEKNHSEVGAAPDPK